jgi:Flp pilus assembly protein TadD
MTLLNSRWQRWTLAVAASAVVLVGGYYGARHYAWPAVKAWRIARMNRDAQAFLDRKDLPNALLAARKSLQASSVNIPAWRICALASKARELPEAIYYQENLVRLEPTKANYVELLRLTLRFQEVGRALDALKTVPPAARDDPGFHQLAAQVYLRARQPLMAKYHLMALLQLRPGDWEAEMDLAEVELAADPDRKDAALRDRVLALADRPGGGARPLALLLRENLATRRVPGTAELVRRLELQAGLDVPQQLLVIEGLSLLADPAAVAMLGRLKAVVAAQPRAVTQVMESLVRLDLAEQVPRWFALLPEETRKDEDVQRTLGETLLRLRDWPALEAHLRRLVWKRDDYLRQALLAYAFRAEGRSAEFAEAWKFAVLSAGTDVHQTNALLTRVDEWKWVTERYALIWKLFAHVPTNESVQRVLVAWEQRQGNTANLNRLFARLMEVEPRNDTVRNNFAYTSLLLDSNLAEAGLIARALVEADPKNPFYATTYALALFKQGHANEALARIDALSAADRSEPKRVLLRSLFLSGTGQAAAAADLLNGVSLPLLLPEERRLAEGAAEEISRLDRIKGNRSRLLAFHENAGEGGGRVGWLPLVADATRRAATTDMQLADSLYATAAWPELEELLRPANWKGEDHLRMALLAYALRERSEWLRSQDAWRQALALADRDSARVQDLRSLVTQWKWPAERLETLNLVFERNPTDRLLCTELLQVYREARRTSEMVRVLGLYLNTTAELSDEAVVHAYYSLLVDSNVAHAHVVARNAFETAPTDALRRQVYAFSLWKQERNSEARALLAGIKPGAEASLAPVALIRALVLMDLGFLDEGLQSLVGFNPASALPEEVALAGRVSSRLPALTVVARPVHP